MKSIVYGPVPSWRLGRSLGIDLISSEGKTCTFDCTYCQLGATIHGTTRRKQFVSIDELANHLKSLNEADIDTITFSGLGEPTLASNLGLAIDLAKSVLDLPVAVLTNSSLMFWQEVRDDLKRADIVVAKLDAADEERFRSINRPAENISFEQTVDGIRRFRREYTGMLALQMMFVATNKENASEMAALALEISPDEVQLNTPLRPCAVKPLSPSAMADIKSAFRGFGKQVKMVYDSEKPLTIPVNMDETLRRRPEL